MSCLEGALPNIVKVGKSQIPFEDHLALLEEINGLIQKED
jgi:hypothetical protein